MGQMMRLLRQMSIALGILLAVPLSGAPAQAATTSPTGVGSSASVDVMAQPDDENEGDDDDRDDENEDEEDRDDQRDDDDDDDPDVLVWIGGAVGLGFIIWLIRKLLFQRRRSRHNNRRPNDY